VRHAALLVLPHLTCPARRPAAKRLLTSLASQISIHSLSHLASAITLAQRPPCFTNMCQQLHIFTHCLLPCGLLSAATLLQAAACQPAHMPRSWQQRQACHWLEQQAQAQVAVSQQQMCSSSSQAEAQHQHLLLLALALLHPLPATQTCR
jgi:hypothetical protein